MLLLKLIYSLCVLYLGINCIAFSHFIFLKANKRCEERILIAWLISEIMHCVFEKSAFPDILFVLSLLEFWAGLAANVREG